MRNPVAAALICLCLAPLALFGCDDGDTTTTTTTTSATPAPTAPQSAQPGAPRPSAPDDAIETRPGGPKDPGHEQKGGDGEHHKEPPGAFPPPRPDPGAAPAGAVAQQGVGRAVRSFIGALDARDGARVCSLLAPGFLKRVDLPVDRGSCAPSVTASIGFAEPGGQPRWRGTSLVDAGSIVLVRGGDARLTGTVVHRFAGSREPSIEDDVIYLRRSGSRWLIVQPSSTFYRAIGVGDVPLSALAPPRG